MTKITLKYQLPNEELDALISVTTDEDVENMIDEYDRVAHNQNPRSARLRLFLFQEGQDSRTNSITSLLNGSANRENWFLDALNGGVSGLERGRSEASSMLSEVPDYLFGLDNSEEANREPRLKDRPVFADNVSASDPGSPAPIVSSPFCSTSSVPGVPPVPSLPPVKTKLENPVPERENRIEAETGGHPSPNPNMYPGNTLSHSHPVIHYTPEAAYSGAGHSPQPVPVYYISAPVQPGTVPVQPVPMQAPYPFVQQPYHAVVPAQVPVGYHQYVPGSGQVYSPGVRHVSPGQPFSPTAAVHDALRQRVYQAVHSGPVPVYAAAAVGKDEPQRSGAEFVTGRGTI